MMRSSTIKEEFLNTWDIELTWERLKNVESWLPIDALGNIIWKNNILNPNERIISDNQIKDIVFDNYGKWMIVSLNVSSELCNEKVEERGKKRQVVLSKDAIIINNDKSEIKSALEKKNWGWILNKNRSKTVLKDVVIDENWTQNVIFYTNHAYSLERCYIDKSTWEKRVWVVNPWHTGIKFDISLEDCKKIFNWEVSYIDIDKLFKQDMNW